MHSDQTKGRRLATAQPLIFFPPSTVARALCGRCWASWSSSSGIIRLYLDTSCEARLLARPLGLRSRESRTHMHDNYTRAHRNACDPGSKVIGGSVREVEGGAR